MFGSMTDHLSELTVAAYVERRLARAERAAAEAHLAQCAACRMEIIEVSRLLPARTRVPRFAVPLTAAALLATALIVADGHLQGGAPVLRSAGSESGIVITAPLDQQVVSQSPELAWHHVPNTGQYRVTITNNAGDIVSEKLSVDTTLVLSALAGGTTFHWYVTAILRNGAAASSSVRTFRTR